MYYSIGLFSFVQTIVNPICLQECWYTKKSQLVVRKGRGADEELGRTSSQVGKELDKRKPRKTTAAPW